MGLTHAMRRDSRRYYDRALRDAESELRAQCAQLRALRRDLRGDRFYEGTGETDRQISEALGHLRLAERILERGRSWLPDVQTRADRLPA